MEPNAKETLLAELERESLWQWRWEKKYRRWYYGVTWASWLSSFLILVLALYQIQADSAFSKWLILGIAALSTLSVSLPVLSMSFKFQQRQEVYDRMARTYSLIRTKLLVGAISVDEALVEFGKLHGQPTEKVIRETA